MALQRVDSSYEPWSKLLVRGLYRGCMGCLVKGYWASYSEFRPELTYQKRIIAGFGMWPQFLGSFGAQAKPQTADACKMGFRTGIRVIGDTFWVALFWAYDLETIKLGTMSNKWVWSLDPITITLGTLKKGYSTDSAAHALGPWYGLQSLDPNAYQPFSYTK